MDANSASVKVQNMGVATTFICKPHHQRGVTRPDRVVGCTDQPYGFGNGETVWSGEGATPSGDLDRRAVFGRLQCLQQFFPVALFHEVFDDAWVTDTPIIIFSALAPLTVVGCFLVRFRVIFCDDDLGDSFGRGDIPTTQTWKIYRQA